MLNLTVTVDRGVIDKLHKLGERAFMLDQAMDNIGKRVTNYFAGEAFASQGGVYDSVWKALSPSYALYKATGHTIVDRAKWRTSRADVYPGAGPLIRTGAMQKGFYYQSDAKSVVINNRMAEGENPYFIYQQEGTSRGLPARKMMAVNDDIREIIRQEIASDIDNKIKEVGL